MSRNPALDGLRGVAIALVLADHLFIFQQGWIGVDIFFVLSGYLITTILLNEREETHFWKMFYTRRVTRIFPPFLLLLLLAAIFAPVNWRVLGPYLIFFAANAGVWKHTLMMRAAGLDILWSLAVEEHFYFVWPALVRRLSRRTLAIGLLIVVALEPVARSLLTLRGADWRITYLLTPFRLDGLAAGALIALALTQVGFRDTLRRVTPYLLPISAAALAVSFPFLIPDVHVLFCSAIGFPLIAIASAAAVAHTLLNPSTVFVKILSFKPLAFLGRISYGVYLYHMLVLLGVTRLNERFKTLSNYEAAALASVLTLLCAWLSFRFYESLFLDWGRRKVGYYREEQAVLLQGQAQ